MIVEEQLLKACAVKYGVDPGSFLSLGGTDGAVYRCRINNRAYVMKFIPTDQQKKDAYLEKVAFASYLAEHDVPIATPIESMEGKRVEQIEGKDHDYLVTVTPLADGRHPQQRNLYDWNENLFRRWGQVMGHMHALARVYPAWEKPPATVGEPAGELQTTALDGWREEHQFFADWCKEPQITAKWIALYPLLDALPRDRSNYGLIHNDLHQNNFFYHPDVRGAHPITVIDFDVCGYHWFMNDIAIAVYHAAANSTSLKIEMRRKNSRIFLEQFMYGYTQENQLEEMWLIHLPLFMKYREILLYIALTNSWPEEERLRPWNRRWLAEKRARTLANEPII